MRIISQQGIADVFGVSRETIDNWQSDGMPIEVRGGPGVPSQYDSAKCIAWRVESEVFKVRGESPHDRLARVKADKIEMGNAVEREKLTPTALLEPKMKAAMVAAREYLRNQPPRIARLVQGKSLIDVEEALSATFDEFLTKLSRWPLTETDEDES